MSGVRVLADVGDPLRATVDGGSPQWNPEPDDEDFFPSDDGAAAASSCSRAGHRSSWTEGFDFQEVPHGGGVRRSFGGFRRRMSPARLQVVSDVTRLRHRSSSGGRRYSDTTAGAAAAGERYATDGLGVVKGPGGQGRLLRLSRDATQPTSGSVSDLRGSTEPGEESDALPALGAASVVRPRSFTCPDDIKVMQRRTKIRLLHRPPTPTPGDEAAAADGGLLAVELRRSCSLTDSGEIFVDNEEEEEEEDQLPAISET